MDPVVPDMLGRTILSSRQREEDEKEEAETRNATCCWGTELEDRQVVEGSGPHCVLWGDCQRQTLSSYWFTPELALDQNASSGFWDRV